MDNSSTVKDWIRVLFGDPYFASMLFASYLYQSQLATPNDLELTKKVKESSTVPGKPVDFRARAIMLSKIVGCYESPDVCRLRMENGSYTQVREFVIANCGNNMRLYEMALAAFSSQKEHRKTEFLRPALRLLQQYLVTSGGMSMVYLGDETALLFEKELKPSPTNPERPSSLFLTVLFSEQKRVRGVVEIAAAAGLRNEVPRHQGEEAQGWSLLIAPTYDAHAVESASPLGGFKVSIIDPFGLLMLLNFFNLNVDRMQHIVAELWRIFYFTGFFEATTAVEVLEKELR